MPNPLKKTFDFLSTTENSAAIDLLLYGLDIPQEAVRVECLNALLRRRSSRAMIDIVRRFDRFSPDMLAILERASHQLGAATRQALLNGDPPLRANALQLIRQTRDAQQIPTLLSLLESTEMRWKVESLRVLRDLINTLYAALHDAPDDLAAAGIETRSVVGLPAFRDLPKLRLQTLEALEKSCEKFVTHQCEEVVEWLIALGGHQDLATRRVFNNHHSTAASLIPKILETSLHPGVMQAIIGVAQENYPHQAAFRAISHRRDPEFAAHFLRHWPRRLTVFQQKNYRQIQSVAWLEPEAHVIDLLPPGLHPALIQFLLASGLPQSIRFNVLEWMVRYGSPEGRLAATSVLCDLEDNQIQDVILDGLVSEEPDVQAWATSQLRVREIPHCFELLIERLDSPHAEVQQAARQELGDFNVQRVLEMVPLLEPARRIAVGQLLLKIDPDAIQKLIQEMSHAVRRKRIQAARAALGMNLQADVIDGLDDMLHDTDALVRRTAAEVLGYVPSRRAIELLNSCQDDRSPRVREAVLRALDQLRAEFQHPTTGSEGLIESGAFHEFKS